MIGKSIGQQLLMTKYLIERDALSLCFSRFGSGFCPPSELRMAQTHIETIQGILKRFEDIKDIPKTVPVANNYQQLMEGCCPKK